MIRVVADTNVLISAFLADGPPHRFLRHCLAGRVVLIVSPQMLEELAGVLERPKFDLGSTEIARILQIVVGIAEVIDARQRRGLVPADPDDDAVVCAALDGGAACIVTGDSALLRLGESQGIEIMSVARFLK